MRGLLLVAVVVGSVCAAALADAEPVQPRTAAPAPASPKAKPKSLRDWGAKDAAKEPVKQPGTPRMLQAQGMTAYKAGNYNAAVRKFAAAMDGKSSPELIYQAAQAYRLKGERGKALELYEQYLAVAPNGSAAPVCRWYVERLRATP
jgi:tetratricopeptide (TPR) repeat protein